MPRQGHENLPDHPNNERESESKPGESSNSDPHGEEKPNDSSNQAANDQVASETAQNFDKLKVFGQPMTAPVSNNQAPALPIPAGKPGNGSNDQAQNLSAQTIDASNQIQPDGDKGGDPSDGGGTTAPAGYNQAPGLPARNAGLN